MTGKPPPEPLRGEDAGQARRRRDQAWIEKARRGDPEAMTSLIDAYLPIVLGFLHSRRLDHATAEDLAQETFERVLRTLPTFHLEKPFLPWVLAIAHHRLIDLKRRADCERRHLLAAPPSPDLDGTAHSALARMTVAGWLDRLGADERFLLEMRVLFELPFSELARLTGEKEATLRSRVCRLLARLRDDFAREAEIS
jgi:RNA polymerase sigma factor (sigma-70 family)